MFQKKTIIEFKFVSYLLTDWAKTLKRVVSCAFLMGSICDAAQVYQFENTQIGQLKINLVNAKINLKESLDGKLTIAVQDPDFNERTDFKHQLLKTGQDLMLTQKSYEDISDLSENILKSKQIIVDITATHPLFINVRELVFKTEGYKKDLLIQAIKGDINLNKTNAKLTVDLQKGQFTLVDHIGSADLNFYQTQSKIVKVTGNLDMKLFLGKAEISQVSGVISTHSSESEILVDKSQTYQFEARAGLVTFKDILGRVDGSSTEGTISAHLAKGNDIHLKTQSGKVFLHNHFKSGTFVNLMAEEGEILTSNDVKVYTVAGQRIARGTLKGADLGGAVKIRTVSGAIIFK